MVEATLSPSAHMASLGGPSNREAKGELGQPGQLAWPHRSGAAESCCPPSQHHQPFCKEQGHAKPPQSHCPVQDGPQPFSKGEPRLSPGWEAHEVCSHPTFLHEGQTQKRVGLLGQLQETALGTATPQGGHGRRMKQALPSAVSLGSEHACTH